ncbi:hypothetical protein ACQYWQ_05590 [Streptomyces sp. P6-2-1]|uniref:hypothetical protein n=1 Tax=unclassified Streptomyces TaxID=2593676 RepID=UPI003D36E333
MKLLGPLVLLLVVVLLVVLVAGRGPRAWARRRLLPVLGVLLVVYFVGRAVAELVVIDWGDPSSYAKDWGGPHLAGVLAVHCGPGLLALGLAGWWWRARRRRAGADRGEGAPSA